MSSEVPEGVAPSPDRPSRRGGEGGAPVSGALTIVLAVIAVVAGFLILRAITNDGDGGSSLPTSPGGTAAPAPDDDEDDPTATSSTTEPAPTSTTEPALVTEGAVVVVANANNVNGSAGSMSDLLDGEGFEMGTPVNASTGQLPTTVIYIDPTNESAQAVADSVNRVLGGDAAISEIGTPAPTESGELDGDVLVLLGNDKAGSSLEELAPSAAGDDETTVTAPDVAGDDGDTETTDPGTTDPDTTDADG